MCLLHEDIEKAYRDISPALNLDYILCNIVDRKFDNGGIFSFYNRTFKIVSDKPDRILSHRGNIQVLFSPVFGVKAAFAGIVYETVPFIQPKKTTKSTSPKKHTLYIPPDSHYYKHGHQLIKKVTFEDDDIAILKMLEKIFLQNMSA